MIGMLYAIRKTPLHDRLASEGRLDPSDEPEFGTNVIPLKISREELRDGYVRVMNDLYTPEAYFARLDSLFIDGKLNMGQARARYWRRHRWEGLKTQTIFLAQAVGLYVRMMRGVPEAALRREYRRRVWNLVRSRPDPGLALFYVIKCAMHYHAHYMARQMASGRSPIFNSY
jgi:hypothetical protein